MRRLPRDTERPRHPADRLPSRQRTRDLLALEVVELLAKLLDDAQRLGRDASRGRLLSEAADPLSGH
jgi:hypothetical protein